MTPLLPLHPKLWDSKHISRGSTHQQTFLTIRFWTCFFLKLILGTFLSFCPVWILGWACVQVKIQHFAELNSLDKWDSQLHQDGGYQVPVGILQDFTQAVGFGGLCEWAIWASTAVSLMWGLLCRCGHCTSYWALQSYSLPHRRGKVHRRKSESLILYINIYNILYIHTF